MKIYANYVSPENMHLVRWYLPLRPGVRWYYHCDLGRIDASLHTPLELVDPSLRAIIQKLNAAGKPTLASCEGHWLSESEFQAILAQLRKDEQQIRTVGLPLLDLHTRDRLIYFDPNYRRPNEVILREEVYDHQGMGFYSYLDGDEIVFVRFSGVRGWI